METLRHASDRLFRAYYRHCQSSDEDTLFNFLNAIHSFHDKLREFADSGMEESLPFWGIRALRNLFHHEAELLNEIEIVTAIAQSASSEIIRVCLVPRTLVEKAAEKVKRGREKTLSSFRWYGNVADIEPAIFNVCVDAYEKISSLDVSPTSDAFSLFAESYKYETENGFPHHVTGEISCRVGDIEKAIERMQKFTLESK